mmetsp:Transcript_8095/g.25192  ORF Transcript_8095/g.25192 Transcript_8095/m.25192 type:complete len:242 (+) Transcript_8095:1044-1769(+)
MHKVECNVRCVGAFGADELLEAVEEGARRRLALHEPAVVEAHLALGEAQKPLALRVQAGIGRQEGAKEGQHVVQGHVVIQDPLALAVVAKGAVTLLDCGAQGLVLHHVVDRGEHQHRPEAVLAHSMAAARMAGGEQQARGLEELVALAPREVVEEVDPLLVRGHAVEALVHEPLRAGALQHGLQAPLVVVAEDEALLAVHVQAHEPVDRVKGAEGPRQLLPAAAATAQHLLRALAGAVARP